MAEQWMRPSEVEDKYRLHPDTLRGLARDGEIEYFRTDGGQFRYLEISVRLHLGLPERDTDQERFHTDQLPHYRRKNHVDRRPACLKKKDRDW